MYSPDTPARVIPHVTFIIQLVFLYKNVSPFYVIYSQWPI